jgi:2'-5' RNA ligase
MKETIRTFIAIKISAGEKLLHAIAQLQKSLAGEEIRWADRDQLHLTLRFIGETNQFQAAEIIELLGSISKLFQPFQFELKGLGVFKKKIQPRVLFVSVENDLALKHLADEILGMVKSLGFKAEENHFKPHLTLGRMKFIQNKTGFYSIVNRFSDVKFQTVVVSEIIFYQSILGSKGPTYKPIKIVEL